MVAELWQRGGGDALLCWRAGRYADGVPSPPGKPHERAGPLRTAQAAHHPHDRAPDPLDGGPAGAKLLASILAGLAVGVVAEGLAAALETAGLAARGIPVSLTGGDFARLLGGGAVAAGLFAAIGVGIGAAVRNQIGTIIGLCVWSLLIETILIGNVPSAGKFTPGAVQTQDPPSSSLPRSVSCCWPRTPSPPPGWEHAP